MYNWQSIIFFITYSNYILEQNRKKSFKVFSFIIRFQLASFGSNESTSEFEQSSNTNDKKSLIRPRMRYLN